MKSSKILLKNGNPCLCIGDKELPACAYMTYFDERNDYAAFAQRGFKIYSVSVSLASQPINTGSGFVPFTGGVFDSKDVADFSVVDDVIDKILKVCPDAYIFPRIYVCMPEWWIQENWAETVPVSHGKRRESLYSEKFRQDAGEMLITLIEHFKSFGASDRIFGYQISGGNTQEWFHLDLNGSYCEHTLPYFNKYLQNKYPGTSPLLELPDIEQLKTCVDIKDRYLTEYLRFASEEVAKTIDILCKAAKDAVEYKQIVGVFYGYAAEVCDPLLGTHALSSILDSQNIDFISSPNSYMDGRALGIDWPDMLPVDSIKLHGKMCFMECDIRTFLTMSPGQSRPGSDPLNFYSNKVWEGPATEELSVYAIRKSLARQLTHKHGLWWFDMFGHWFSCEKLMNEMDCSLELYNNSLVNTPLEFDTEVAVIIDEKSYSYIGSAHPAQTSAFFLRKSLGFTGVPYKFYLAEDFDKIDWQNSSFKAVIFGITKNQAFYEKASQVLDKCKIASIRITAEKSLFTPQELTSFFKESKVFLFSESYDVFYTGNGFAALHAATAGEKEIRFPSAVKCTNIQSGISVTTDVLKFSCSQYETQLFKIEKVF